MANPKPDILRANLDAIRADDPALAELLEQTDAAALSWDTARNGQPIASLPPGNDQTRPIALCSKYDPAAEADKLLGEIDPGKTACVVLLGLGLGYHAEAALQTLGQDALVLLYEPDPALLRAVFEQRDLSKLLAKTNVMLFAGDEIDRATLLSRTEVHAQLFTQGTQLVTLPIARKLHPGAIKQFGQAITDIVAYSRTNIATALVNAARTCRNLANNLDVYAAGATTNELHHAAKGYPAVCVGAGPSLVKNVHLLQDPEVRNNVVVIAVQTALKP
ncbi:MAG: 6-hydroxymethylpterin diphosphokinase MptE-like protein, partial [Planctomycetota bacterium]